MVPSLDIGDSPAVMVQVLGYPTRVKAQSIRCLVAQAAEIATLAVQTSGRSIGGYTPGIQHSWLENHGSQQVFNLHMVD